MAQPWFLKMYRVLIKAAWTIKLPSIQGEMQLHYCTGMTFKDSKILTVAIHIPKIWKEGLNQERVQLQNAGWLILISLNII